MKLAFISNFYNLHQKPICRAFSAALGKNFTFIETTKMDADRKEMGFQKEEHPDFLLNILESESHYEKAEEILQTYDVVILGSCPKALQNLRLSTGKLTYKYSERFFKGEDSFCQKIRFFIMAMRHIRGLQRYSNLFFLCASAYTAQDINRYFPFENRALKWGYFRDLPIGETKKQEGKMLWVGRMTDWKHPDLAIKACCLLKEKGISFHLDMIGNGEDFEKIRHRIQQENLFDCVTLHGAKTPTEVEQQMQSSPIFIATSDFKEGWGMVINEAMGNGCATVASHAMGSAPFLLQHKNNGMIFQSGNVEDLATALEWLLNHTKQAEQMGCKARETLQNLWNAELAVERLLALSNQLLQGEEITFYPSGPCSKAEIISNDWISQVKKKESKE